MINETAVISIPFPSFIDQFCRPTISSERIWELTSKSWPFCSFWIWIGEWATLSKEKLLLRIVACCLTDFLSHLVLLEWCICGSHIQVQNKTLNYWEFKSCRMFLDSSMFAENSKKRSSNGKDVEAVHVVGVVEDRAMDDGTSGIRSNSRLVLLCVPNGRCLRKWTSLVSRSSICLTLSQVKTCKWLGFFFLKCSPSQECVTYFYRGRNRSLRSGKGFDH